MGKVISLPKRIDRADAKVLQMQAFVRSNLIDLAEQRKRLVETQKEIRKLKARLTLRLVPNDHDGKTS